MGRQWFLKAQYGTGGGGSSTLYGLDDVSIETTPPTGASLIMDAPELDGGTGEWIDKKLSVTLQGTLTAGSTTLTFTDDIIEAYGAATPVPNLLEYLIFDVYTSINGAVPYSREISNHTLTLKFVPQSVDVKVYVVLQLLAI